MNYRSLDLIKEIEDILKFWLDRGVYGFRCDVINKIYKTSLDDDNTPSPFVRGEKYYLNSDQNFQILIKFRTNVLDNYDTFLVGETFGIDYKSAKRFIDERCLDMFFEFDHAAADKDPNNPLFKAKFSVKRLIEPIFRWQHEIGWMANYLENHDQLRSVSRYGDDGRYHKESAKLLALFLLTLKGTPFIYQGEEIGMRNLKDRTIENCKDISLLSNVKTLANKLNIPLKESFNILNQTENRDHTRTPMQRNKQVNAGFNKGSKPWIDTGNDYAQINVEDELNDEDSILNFYKKLIHFRNNNETLIDGDILEEIISDNIVAYFRRYNDEKLFVLLNFSASPARYNTKYNLELLISNYKDKDISFDNLPPYYAGLYRIS